MQNYKIDTETRINSYFFVKCKIGFYQMQKAVRNYLFTFVPEFNIS